MTATDDETGYSVANARRFGWASVAPVLDPDRVAFLASNVVGRTVLDAGCGGGGYVDHLCRAGFDATGVDKHDMFLDLSAERGFAGRFVRGDLTERLPFPDRAFDTTICLDVLEHVDDATALRELVRVTRTRILLTVPRDASALEEAYRLTLIPYKDPTHLRYYTEDMVRALAATVAPRAVAVAPEQLIRVERFVWDCATPRSRRPLLDRVYRRLFRFLMRRAAMRRDGEAPLSMNWSAVIDLAERGGES